MFGLIFFYQLINTNFGFQFFLFSFLFCEARSGMFQSRSSIFDGWKRGTTKNMVVATTGCAHHAHRAKGSGIREKSARWENCFCYYFWTSHLTGLRRNTDSHTNRMRRLPTGFIDLSQDDQLILIKVGFFELWLCYVSRLATDLSLTFYDGTFITRQQLELIYDVWDFVCLKIHRLSTAHTSPIPIVSCPSCAINPYALIHCPRVINTREQPSKGEALRRCRPYFFHSVNIDRNFHFPMSNTLKPFRHFICPLFSRKHYNCSIYFV